MKARIIEKERSTRDQLYMVETLGDKDCPGYPIWDLFSSYTDRARAEMICTFIERTGKLPFVGTDRETASMLVLSTRHLPLSLGELELNSHEGVLAYDKGNVGVFVLVPDDPLADAQLYEPDESTPEWCRWCEQAIHQFDKGPHGLTWATDDTGDPEADFQCKGIKGHGHQPTLHGPPQELVNVQLYARIFGCDWIMFDADGPTVEDLPTWDW